MLVRSSWNMEVGLWVMMILRLRWGRSEWTFELRRRLLGLHCLLLGILIQKLRWDSHGGRLILFRERSFLGDLVWSLRCRVLNNSRMITLLNNCGLITRRYQIFVRASERLILYHLSLQALAWPVFLYHIRPASLAFTWPELLAIPICTIFLSRLIHCHSLTIAAVSYTHLTLPTKRIV